MAALAQSDALPHPTGCSRSMFTSRTIRRDPRAGCCDRRAAVRAVTDGAPKPRNASHTRGSPLCRAARYGVDAAGSPRAPHRQRVKRHRLAAHMRRSIPVGDKRPHVDDALTYEAVAWLMSRGRAACLGVDTLICNPVRNIAGASQAITDGGLIDYHLLWPYGPTPGLVLYPHFVPGHAGMARRPYVGAPAAAARVATR